MMMHPFTTLMESYCQQQGLDHLNGIHQTNIDGVWFYRADSPSARQPLVYQSGIIIMGQGQKRVHLSEQAFDYGPGDYLVLGVPLPLECEAWGQRDEPLLGIAIDIDPQLLAQIAGKLSHFNHNTSDKTVVECGLVARKMAPTLEQAVIRLLDAMLDDAEANILGSSIIKEIIYRILIDKQGRVLFDLVNRDSHYSRIAQTLHWLHQNYPTQISVEQLAKTANMSLSSFHRAFRQVTLESPLQYLKKVRLDKAKELIIKDGKRINDVAELVGYTSPSQFSREFKRHFKTTPKQAINI
ncbi:AraC family transcriptional regulator N-terminal domain-containing protein [Motilimonas sp. KMU-193]|uniref:AraC family transcriptional regulator n=1 Tax=Motilimonas sp. KMU-193 TaxID=3388668 RepID=UPI00396B2302